MKLFEAVKKNDLELVKKLIKDGHPLNNKEIYGDTALIYASDKGYIEIVKELIKAGASLNEKTVDGSTALMFASFYRYNEIVIELIKAGASLNEKNNLGSNALDFNKEIWRQFEMQDLILTMYPDKYSFLEENVGIHKDILLKLKMQQILDV